MAFSLYDYGILMHNPRSVLSLHHYHLQKKSFSHIDLSYKTYAIPNIWYIAYTYMYNDKIQMEIQS